MRRHVSVLMGSVLVFALVAMLFVSLDTGSAQSDAPTLPPTNTPRGQEASTADGVGVGLLSYLMTLLKILKTVRKSRSFKAVKGS